MLILNRPHFPSPGGIESGILAEYHGVNGLIGGSVYNSGNIKGTVWDLRFSGKGAHSYANSTDGYVPGINDILSGGYTQGDGTKALPAAEKMERGRRALSEFSLYRRTMGTPEAEAHAKALEKDVKYFGYGFIKDEAELVPNVPMVFWSFRVMVGVGSFLVLWFIVMFILARRGKPIWRWALIIGLLTIPMAYVAGEAGWIVAEVGRQPWAVQDLLPLKASVSALPTEDVRITFIVFAIIFTVLLAAGVTIMCRAIGKGPEEPQERTTDTMTNVKA